MYLKDIKMGWHIPYEIVFDGDMEWDDDDVSSAFKSRNVRWMYLHSSIDKRLIVEIYTTYCDIQEVLDILKNTYNCPMKYHLFQSNNDNWCSWR